MSAPTPAPSPPARASSRASGVLAGAAIACGVCLLVCLPAAPGPLGVLGLGLGAGTLVAAGIAGLAALPTLIVTLVPALIPAPLMSLTFAWELAFYFLFGVMLLHGWRRRGNWIWRLEPVEVALLSFTLYAIFTGFWCGDTKFYLLGVRRLVLGAATLWVALRLPEIAKRRWFDLSVLLAAASLALAAIGRSLTTGFSAEQALIHRSQTTDLGWGTANYIASLLLLCSPSLLQLVLRGRRADRIGALGGMALITATQLVVASRAAMVLFVIGALVQVLRLARKFRLWIGLAFAAGVAILFASPAGIGFTSRLDNLREFGSLTIRIWYFREAWSRLLGTQPFGLGLGQGYAHADKLQGIDPHNYWLLLGGDLGIVGTALWAAVLVMLVRALWTLRDREQVHTLTLTVILANLHTLVEPTYQGVQYQLLFFWVIAGAFAYSRADKGVLAHALPASAPLGDALADEAHRVGGAAVASTTTAGTLPRLPARG